VTESLSNRVPRLLVVDDDPSVSALLEHVLGTAGYDVVAVHDGLQALDSVQSRRPDLVLLDIDMPRMTGDEVCRRLKSNPATRLIPVIMITAQGDLPRRLDAWDYGADEFLSKPFQTIEVTARCRSLLRIKKLVDERDSAEAVVFALARAVEAKSPYTHGHSERVMGYVDLLAEHIGLSEVDRETLRKGSLLHDVGKISIPDAILDKPGKLTAEEYEVVKLHAAQGAHIVEPLATVRDVVPLIRWHHERPDGRGYPDGLAGDKIPLLVRILSVADVYDSLASDRPYRGRMPHEKCLQILRETALDGGLDPELVAEFAAVLPTRDETNACVATASLAGRASDG
jgi:putative two-component system response regulator